MRIIIGALSGIALLAAASAAQAAPRTAALAPAAESANILTVRADPAVMEVQRHLVAKGFYRGPVDGVAGRLTRAAVRAFERANGHPVTGDPVRLAPRIGYNPPGPVGGPGVGVNPPGPAGGPGVGHNPPGPAGGPGGGVNPPGPAGGPGAGPVR